MVAVYEEAKFGKVDIQYRDKTSQAILETFNTPHDKSSNLINLLGNNYDVTAKVPERFEKMVWYMSCRKHLLIVRDI